MKLRIPVLIAVLLLSLGGVVLLVPPAPAWACSCAEDDPDERAELIVVGMVTAVSDRSIRLAVESVEKGDLADDTLVLRSGRNEASCGYDFRAGARYRVNSVDGATGLCTGVRPLPARPAPSAEPATSGASTTSGTSATSSASATLARLPAAGQSPGGWWPAVGVTVAVAAAALATLAWRRRSTR